MPSRQMKYKKKLFEINKNSPFGLQFGIWLCIEKGSERNGKLHYDACYITIALFRYTIRIGIMNDYDRPITGDDWNEV